VRRVEELRAEEYVASILVKVLGRLSSLDYTRETSLETRLTFRKVTEWC
jgi:hypothetical protein